MTEMAAYSNNGIKGVHVNITRTFFPEQLQIEGVFLIN